MEKIRTLFITAQIVLMGLSWTPARAQTTLKVSAGNLEQLIDKNGLRDTLRLKLVGTINGTDVKYLRYWGYEWRHLDLSDCRIVSGGEPYWEQYTTEDDVIGPHMFESTAFGSLKLPNTLKRIDEYGLFVCGDSIEFPPSLTWLGDHAFTVNHFTKLHIPATLTHIGNGALTGNIGLEQVTIDADNPEYVMEDGFLYTRDHTRLLAYFAPIYPFASEFRLHPSVKTVDDWAFSGHRAKHLILNEGLEYIGDNAFRYTLADADPGLKLVIPNSVTHIGTYAFMEGRIDTLIISDNVEEIPLFAFYDCRIDYIHLPSRLKHLGRGAIWNSLLYNLVLPEGLESVGGGALSRADVGTLVIPESLKYMDTGAFECMYMDTLDIRAPLDSIPTRGFYGCPTLLKLILPPTLKRIGNAAFFACYHLEDCKLPDGLEEIGDWALAGADYMTEWHIPASVRKIGADAFAVPNDTWHTIYMYSEQPPQTHILAFEYWVMDRSVLYVPLGCTEKYRHLEPWSQFGSIREFDPTAIHRPRPSAECPGSRGYDIGGRPLQPGSRGLQIVRDNDGRYRKVVR